MNTMKKLMQIVTMLVLVAYLGACGGGGGDTGAGNGGDGSPATASDTGNGGGDTHADDHDHDHGDEVDLGTVTVEGIGEVSGAQGHGKVMAGVEGHLVIKLPYNDDGASVVRAWIGTEDPTDSHVGLGEYAPSHDDYDIHADAPDPLPDDAQWWFEIEKPDGTVFYGTLPILR